MSNENNTGKSPMSSLPAWHDMVDQSNPAALARFFSSMPYADSVTHDFQAQVLEEAVERACFGPNFFVELKDTHFRVVPYVELKDPNRERYYSCGGTHASYGNFVLFWSARGPGDGVRPRPCFMFWDDEAVMIGGAQEEVA